MLEHIRERLIWREPLQHFEIVTPLSVEECRKRLTGREKLGRLYDGFARPLGFDGQVGPNFLTINLDNAQLSGRFVPIPDGTRLTVFRASASPWWINKLLLPPLFVAGFIAVTWSPGDSPTPPFICLTAALGITMFRNWRRWRRFNNTSRDAEAAVRIIANLVLATSMVNTRPADAEASAQRSA